MTANNPLSFFWNSYFLHNIMIKSSVRQILAMCFVGKPLGVTSEMNYKWQLLSGIDRNEREHD